MMDSNGSPPPSHRSTFLIFLLSALAAAGFLVFLVGLLGPFAIYAAIIVVLVAALGAFHYLIWGRSFSDQTAGEKDEDDQETNGDYWPREPHDGRRL